MQSNTSADTESNVTNIRKDNIFSNSGVSGDVVNIGEAGGNVTISSTDHGAVAAAMEANQEVSRAAFEEAFGFGGAALDTVGDTTAKALDTNRAVTSDFLGSFEWQQQQTTQQIGRALDGMQSAITNDGAETMQSAFKWTAVAVGIGASAYFVSRMQ